MFKKNRLARDLISDAIRRTVDELVREHYGALTQEHQLTSRLCQQLESTFSSMDIFGYRVRVITQELPDKGPGSMEKKIGADIYIGFDLLGEESISKGVFIQSKWHEEKRNKKEQEKLVEQCANMLWRSHASYLWLYGSAGVEVVPANENTDTATRHPESLNSRNLSEMIRGVLDCVEGDRGIGMPKSASIRSSIKEMLHRFEGREHPVSHLIAVQIAEPDADRR